MKSFKKILIIFMAAFLVLLPINARSVNAEEGQKVKVYIFEAGGCPFCEQEKEYLKSLDSYGEKFEIVEKELYVDHVEWAQGADYELGKKVATAFKEAGFKDAEYNATPLVIISDLYAAATYSEDLEEIIDEAYEKGDKDVVGCYENNGTNCLAGVKDSKGGISPDTICLIIMIVFVVGTVVFVILSRKSTKQYSPFEEKKYVSEEKTKEVVEDEEIEDEDDEEEVVKEEKNNKKTAKNNTSTKTTKTSKSKNQKKVKNK